MTTKPNLTPWALICRESNDDLGNFWPDDVWIVTERLTVPGGWVVRSMIEGDGQSPAANLPATMATVFVPCSICAGTDSVKIKQLMHHRHWSDLTPEGE